MAGARKTEEAKELYDAICDLSDSQMRECFGTSNMLEILCYPYEDAKKKYEQYINMQIGR